MALDPRNRRRRGLKILRELGWGTNPDLEKLDSELWRLITEFVFGEIWPRPGLNLRERVLIVLAVLITLGTEGMDLVLRHAHKVGITERQIKEVIYQVMYYAGQPKGLFAMKRLKSVMAEAKSGQKGRKSKRNSKVLSKNPKSKFVPKI